MKTLFCFCFYLQTYSEMQISRHHYYYYYTVFKMEKQEEWPQSVLHGHAFIPR